MPDENESLDVEKPVAAASPPMPKPETATRRHDLDALRAVAMLLGIVLHASLSFHGGWMVRDTQRSEVLGIVMAAVHGFRMPLFFLLSGFFTAMLWRRRGLNFLIRHRLKRIFLPFVLCMVTLIPLTNVVSGWAMRNAAVISKGVEDVWTAARVGDLESIRRFSKGGTDLDAGDPLFGATPLIIASLHGQTEAVTLLLAEGATTTARGKDGGTPLHAAAFLGHAEIAEALLNAGAILDMKNKRGETPVDALQPPWPATKLILGLLKIEAEKEKLMAGREKIGALFADRRSQPERSVPIVDQPNKPAAGWGILALFTEPVFHHLWFLWFLCWLIAAFLFYAMLLERQGWKRAPDWMTRSALRYAWLVPLTMLPQSIMGTMFPTFGPDTSVGLLPMPHVLFYYAIFFGFGALYYDNRDEEGRLGRWWMFTLPISLVILFPIGYELTYGGLGFKEWFAEPLRQPLSVALQSLYAWLMTCGLIGMFRHLLHREHRSMRYLSDSSYWLYLAHLPLIILMQALVREWQLPALLKCAVICISVSGVLLIMYQTMVRYTWIGRMLNGPKKRPEKTA